MLSKTDFITLMRQEMCFQPTSGQTEAIRLLAEFICQNEPRSLFLLKGYAGTGKTTIVSALVKALAFAKQDAVLLAPTGRAAKVFSNYADRKAYTIHKHLYRTKMVDGLLHFGRKKNVFKNKLFIVDEASMISDKNFSLDSQGRTLLDDLISYVFEGENCKLLFIGDEAQLPPVGEENSPALMPDYLTRNFSLQLTTYQLTDVVRQALDSGILYNANNLRQKIGSGDYDFPLFTAEGFPDFNNVEGSDLEELLNTLYGNYEYDEVVVITPSNKRAILYNNEIRNRILYRESSIATGDYLMTVKNNYHWVDESSPVGFIANGDMLELMAIQKRQELYGFHFADVTVRLCDYPDYPTIDIKIILDSLQGITPALSAEENNRLYHEVAKDYEEIPNKRTRYLKMKADPYLNALQVKFGYSLTCHKTQGGQWKVVLVDQLFFKDKPLDKEFLRWLYTAVTRATEKVYLVNFPEKTMIDV
ncbi:tRNA (adenosine(37)-N6)-threonylcarbamoyltransferase complex ATPase subunit type 1 TsaE [Bacteroidales bacterium OttesenSCG-928-B11]|nr:tRNA (adenosine(37)-N6)-threonylcarbamoyltransferase complex ATPase subunit type 1 TsaE [Bacteroidales bacterium OttesenSCG-928-B11]MDL2326711.1 tRNA (adenosine(37)-N6)-threonylcarbamoyltransferase complex ATPase subunit type 1 TsaE [Bacteroidales bacterium OttesenSCG-928-A14]